MSNTIEGANAVNDNANFESVSQPFFYSEDEQPAQVYLEAVLPRVRDPTLIPFNTRALNPVKYDPEQTLMSTIIPTGFHPVTKNPNAYVYDNTDFRYFQPENF